MRSVFAQGMHHVRFVIDCYCSAHLTRCLEIELCYAPQQVRNVCLYPIFLLGSVYLDVLLIKIVIYIEEEYSGTVWRKGFIHFQRLTFDKSGPFSLLVSICSCTDGTFVNWDAVENYKSHQSSIMHHANWNGKKHIAWRTCAEILFRLDTSCRCRRTLSTFGSFALC